MIGAINLKFIQENYSRGAYIILIQFCLFCEVVLCWNNVFIEIPIAVLRKKFLKKKQLEFIDNFYVSYLRITSMK